MKYLLDTSAWIEFLHGTEKGRVVARLVDRTPNNLLTSDASFAEIYAWALREDRDPGDAISFIRNNSELIETYTNLWVEGAHYKCVQRKKRPQFGLVDGILLAVQKLTGATIVTCDPHFKGLKKVRML